MADVQQHTPPGGWPRGKSKDVGDHHSRDQSPSQYFDDDSTTLKESRDAATDTTESTAKSAKKKIDDSSQDDDGSTAKSTKKKIDDGSTTKSAKKKIDDSSQDDDGSKGKTVKSTKKSADKKAKSTTDSADDKTKSTKDKAVKSAKSKGNSDSKEEDEEGEESENNPMDEFQAGLKGGDNSDLKKVEPEPFELTEEEKKKLTPRGDISNVTKAAEAAKAAKSKSDGAKSKADDASKSEAKDDVKGDVPKTDGAEDSVKEATGKDASKKDLPEGDAAADAEGKADSAKADATDAAGGAKADATDAADGAKTDLPDRAKEGVADKADDAKKDLPEGEEAAADAEAKVGEAGEAGKDVEAPEGAEIPKEGEEALKEGQETADDAAKDGQEATDEAVKEGEEAAKDAEEEAPLDLSILKNGKINKGGNVISEDGKLVGRVKEGVLAHLINKRVDENGIIWSDSGKQLGKAELIPEDEREAMNKEDAPFEAFPDAKVDGEGFVISGEERIGKVVEGDIKKLRNMKVDADGDILDRQGSVVGHAERWEPEAEPEPEPEPEKDRSILAGKRVNKSGNLVDSSGALYGRVIEGDLKRMIGRMSDAKGIIRSESGDELGRAEVIPEGEREGMKEGPFAELSGCTVRKDGKIVTAGNEVVGRLISGDPKVLAGREVDDDGEICDRNGNVIGKAERWEEPEAEEKAPGPLAGRKVNKEGLVTDSDGNVIAKLTSGDLSICAGKEIDDDNDVVVKGAVVGHVTLLGDIKEPEESADDKAKREKAESDKKLAQQMSYCLTQCLDKIKPICQMITSKIEKAERTPKEELDEEELVKEVRPLIEEGGKILQEANGIIRGLDPDGRIQANAKHKTATHEATPEEYHLADILKELTGTVTQTIDNAKKKIEGMPHAKKELNPLWGLLSEPLFQILAAVGLLLNGVLGLVGRLLSGLGLGGLVDSLLGGLGVKNILEALGIGSLTDSLTGKNQKGGKKKGGGLLGLGG